MSVALAVIAYQNNIISNRVDVKNCCEENMTYSHLFALKQLHRF